MTKPMTKTQLVTALASEMGADKKTAGAAIDALSELITREVANGGAVTLPGIGKIYCRERPERMVRNPATGQQIRKDIGSNPQHAVEEVTRGVQRSLDLLEDALDGGT